jgi:hypothetical protein
MGKNGGDEYPSDPGIAGLAKGQAPGGLEGLEVLVGLEKGAQSQGIGDAECKQQGEKSAGGVVRTGVGSGGRRGSHGLAEGRRH